MKRYRADNRPPPGEKLQLTRELPPAVPPKTPSRFKWDDFYSSTDLLVDKDESEAMSMYQCCECGEVFEETVPRLDDTAAELDVFASPCCGSTAYFELNTLERGDINEF